MEILSLQPRATGTLPHKAAGTNPIFTSLPPQRSIAWPGFAISLVLHVLGVLLVPPLTIVLTDESDQQAWMRHMKIVDTLRIRVPEHLYVASSGPSAVPQKVLLAPSVQLREAPPAPPASRLAPKEGPKRSSRRHFELPRMPRRTDTTQTILQPEFAPDQTPPLATRLPEVFFWAPRRELPRFVKPFVEPGHQAEPAKPRLLDAPPALAVPLSEPSAAPVPGLPDLMDVFRPAMPPALPVQTSQPQNGAPQTGVSADRTSGDPTTLLSLAVDPQRMRELLAVPPGNQLGQLPEGGASGPVALTAASGQGGRNTGSGSGSGPGSDKAAKPVESTTAATPAEPSAAEAAAAATAALRAMALAAAASTRIVNPAGGVFDVVVQSNGTEGFPESAGVLSGKPVYSVYVRVGGGHDWLLQYCIAGEEETGAQVDGYVVRLTVAAPLTAPYARVTMRPPVKQRPGHHVMVHGYVTVEGRFRDLKVLSASAESEAEMVEAVLEKWEFRAAARNGKPIEVEVLLAIPAE